MALLSSLFKTIKDAITPVTSKVDPALQAQLEKRNMTAKLDELKNLVEGTKAANLPTGQTAKSIAGFITGGVPGVASTLVQRPEAVKMAGEVIGRPIAEAVVAGVSKPQTTAQILQGKPIQALITGAQEKPIPITYTPKTKVEQLLVGGKEPVTGFQEAPITGPISSYLSNWTGGLGLSEEQTKGIVQTAAIPLMGLFAEPGLAGAEKKATKELLEQAVKHFGEEAVTKVMKAEGEAGIKKMVESVAPELAQTIRQAKPLSAEDIMAKHPDINLKKDVPITDIRGNKKVITAGEALTPYELKGNKVLLQDGETYIVSKNQYQNIKGQSVKAEAKEFAPELKGTEETVKGGYSDELVNIEKQFSDKGMEIRKEMGGEVVVLDKNGEIMDEALLETKYPKLFDAAATYESLVGNEAVVQKAGRATKFSQYQLPDGKNYKEILIKAPDTANEAELKALDKKWSSGTQELTDQEVVRRKELKANQTPFTSSHWDEPNVISHLRLNEREFNGKKVTFMEELQSDWAREARDKGLINNGTPEEIKRFDELIIKRNRYQTNDAEDVEFGKLAEKLNPEGGIVGHPLLKNWQELSVKRGLKDAVDNGSEYFAWTTGEQQAARYNLSKEVDGIRWNTNNSGTKSVQITPKGGGGNIAVEVSADGKITSGGQSDWKGKTIGEAIGKGVGDKIASEASGNLKGEGLNIGGEWAKNLYDKQVKNIVEDVTGGKVETLDMGLPVDKGGSEFSLKGSGEHLTVKDIKIGQEVDKGTGEGFDTYIITDVLGDGKFKAVPKYSLSSGVKKAVGLKDDWSNYKDVAKELNIENKKQEFDISVKKSAGQQGIKLTPEIKARIKGEAPELKKPSGRPPVQAYGAMAGIEVDEEGNVKYSPEKGALGIVGLHIAKGKPLEGLLKGKEAIERGFVSTVKEKTPELAIRVAGQYIPRSTDELAIKAKNLIKDNIVTAHKLASSGTDDKAVATAMELVHHYNNLAEKAISEGEKLALYDKAAEVVNEIAPKLTEMGRAVQAASIYGNLTPEGILRFAAKEIDKYNKVAKIKIPELTGEQAAGLAAKAKKIMEMEDGIAKAREIKKLQDEIAALLPSSLLKKIITVWKAGLLTGMKTTGVNVMSNLTHGISEIAKDAPAAVVDSVASLFTGKRTLAFTPKGYLSGLKEGFDKGIDYLKTGFDERNMGAKLDYHKVNFGNSKIGKALQKYEETVFGLLGAEDQPFYYGAKSHSLMSQGMAEAKNQGLKGQAAKEFVEKFVANPSDQALTYAVADAEMSVFQNKTALGSAAKKIQQIGGGAAEFVVPFGRTPASVAMQLVNYSPVGIAKEIITQIAKHKFDQKMLSQAIGRGLTGTGVLAIGSALYKKGMLSLEYPSGKSREISQMQLEGRTPNSIYIGGKWRNANILGPLGFVLLVGGKYQQAKDEKGSPMGALATAFVGAMKSVTDQTFLQGLSGLMEAINDPSKFAETFVKSQLGSVIPTIINDLAKGTDPYERESNSILDALYTRVPGLRETLEPKINVLGGTVAKGGNFLETMADPTRPSRGMSSDVINEFKRLNDAGFSTTPTQVAKYKSLTSEQHTELERRAGAILEEKLKNLFSTSEYQALDDEKKSNMIADFTQKARVVARAEEVLKIKENLTGEELKAKLSELKADKVLTQEVFKKYQELR